MNEAQTIAVLSQRLGRRERELRAVHRISAALHANLGLDAFLEQALLAAIETLEAGAGSVALYEPEREALVFRYVHGPTPEVVRRMCGRALSIHQGVCGLVFRTGRGMVTPCADADPHHYEFEDVAAQYDTHNLVTAPMKDSGGKAVGVMQVLNRKRGRFDDEDLKTLEILANQAGAGIETARLHQTILNWEVDRRRFACEVLRCVTGGKLHLAEEAEIPTEGELHASFALEERGSYARMRQAIVELAERVGMDRDLATDLVLAAGEAATNTIKHAVKGRAEIRVTADRLAVDIRDEGPGIRPKDLPRVLFQAGYSTKISLGMGYTLMLELADCIWLATGPQGTHLRLEKLFVPPAPRDDPFREVLERYAVS